VTVVDTTSPIFDSIPSDLQYSEGTTGNTLSWNVTDNYPGTFEVYRNGTLTGDSGSWTNAGFITINVDGLLKGAYNYTIKINDVSNNTISDSVILTVVDTTAPLFVSIPADMQYTEDTTGNTLNWNVTDNYPGTFEVYRNGTLTGDTGSWTNSDYITINIDDLSIAIYNFTIVILDSSSNQVVDTVIVTVVDDVLPTFDSIPSDLSYSEGATGNTLTWNADDKHPNIFEVYRNGSFTGDTGVWNSANDIVINVDDLLKGVYIITIVISDESGNESSDTVMVTVLDTISPVFISTPIDLQYSEGSSGNILSWNATDKYPGTFVVYRNGTLTGDSGSWTDVDFISINIDGLVKGVYNYTIAISDLSDNQISDTVIVTVADTTFPIFDSIPSDYQYSEGTTGNSLSWNATDNYPGTFEVYRNGTLTGDSGSWTDADFISINIDGLVKGVYNYTITISDLSDNQISDTVIVTVVDTTFPIFDPSDLQYSEGTTGNSLSWNATDNYPGIFEMYRNGTLTGDSGSWTNADFITINIDGLAKGIYNYTITISDLSDNQISDTVIVTVVDTTFPIFDSIPSDLQYSEGTTGNTLSWNATDKYPGIFEVYRNGTLTGDTGSWTNTDYITINIDGLTKGVYNYTITISDLSDNKISDTVIVTIVDTGFPIFDSIPSDYQYSEGTTGNTLSWNATDNYPGTFEVYRNGTLTGNSWSWTNADFITINIDGLVKGVYNYTIAISDLSDNQISDTLIV
jgi:uncharacterized protein YvpB